MQLEDLPLLAWQPPRRVLLFPLTKRIGKVRHTALKLSEKNGEDANLYWKQVVAANRKHLERVGLSAEEIDAEIREFFEAVRGEMYRLAYECNRSGQRPGGGAA
ncbi:DUF6074 family protein [Chelativorans sp. J32]|uniref:DUF6074 family protein n=1 Tax=Chelativorans sp. J32 TaxID=935840 RepID=UPI000489332A|nr:DUF6074 family protein [Chelativorans sp. J32]